MDQYISAAFLNGAGVVSVVLLMGLFVVKGFLVPRPLHDAAMKAETERARKAEERADRWEAVALRALDATERLTEPVVVATKVLTTIPTMPEGDSG